MTRPAFATWWLVRRRVARWLLWLALPIGAAGCAHAAPGAGGPSVEARLRALVPALLARLHVPGATVALVRRDRPLWVEAFGQARADGPAATVDTRFEAGSLGKPVFAHEVLLLARRGLVDLDRPLAQILPPPTSDPRAGQITARMVLGHTTGFPNWARGRPFTLAFTPGARWQYSGEAYLYLQRVIEHLTGEPIDASMQRDLFAPLGMSHSAYADPPAPEASWATGHDRAGRPLPVDVHRSAVAASSLRTTAPDYARFLAALLAPGATAEPAGQLLGAVSQVAPELGLSWGLGWALADEGPGQTVFFHWGSNPGFKSFVIGEPARGLGVVLLTDGDDGLEMAEEIVRAVDGAQHPLFRFPMLHPDD
jgi:CubicO group peptidase (beta-lactamase class C family)